MTAFHLSHPDLKRAEKRLFREADRIADVRAEQWSDAPPPAVPFASCGLSPVGKGRAGIAMALLALDPHR
jgi:hypothetical protein